MGEITASNEREKEIFEDLERLVKDWSELTASQRDAWKVAALDDLEDGGVFEIKANRCVSGELYTMFMPSEANLTGANLNEADLTGADLRRSDLTGADLRRSTLNKADLSGAY
ncbi:MAG: pentapeptide repeat-containing protein, partial [Chloroflexota bacterium]